MKALLGVFVLAAVCSPDNAGRIGVRSEPVQTSDPPFLLTQALPKSGVGVVWIQAVNSGDVVVEVEGQPYCDNTPDVKPPHVYEMHVQAWLLRASGTTLAPHGTPTHVAVSNMGCSGNPMQFFFTPLPNENPVAVVLSVDGKLTVAPIPTTSGSVGGSDFGTPSKATVLRAEYGGISWIPIGTVPPQFVVAVVQFDSEKDFRNLQVSHFVVVDAMGLEKSALRLVSIERFDRPRIATEGESAYYLNPGGTTPWDGTLPKGTIRLRVKMEIPHDILPRRFRFALGPYTVDGQICCSWPT